MLPVGPYETLLERFGDYVRVVRGSAPSTVDNCQSYVNQFLVWWLRHGGGLGLDAVRLRHLNDHLVAEAERGMSPATIYAEANGLRIFFGWLTAEEQIPADPTTALVSPRRVPDPDKRCSISNLERECRLAGWGADVAGRHYPHRWRHSLATELIRAGVGVAQVQRQLGHTSVASTMLYTHLRVDDLRGSLDAVFGTGTGEPEAHLPAS